MTPHHVHFLGQNTYPLSENEAEKDEDHTSWGVDWESEEFLQPQKLKSTSFMILLTISMGGIQLVFSVLYSHGMTAITFISGPLTGIFVQPFFGIWSDHCRLSWGKRRPFIAFGGVSLIVSLLCLAWTNSIVSLMFSTSSLWSERSSSGPHDRATATMASLLTFCVFFAIQPAQGGVRALIVDTCPTHQQQHANAWVGRVSGIANVLGYLSAIVDLSQYLSFFGDTQFKGLSVLASLILGSTIILTCTYVVEKDPSRDLPMESDDDDSLGFRDTSGNCLSKKVKNTYHEVIRLPKRVVRICLIQFLAWLGWYPYLLYATTYLGEIYITESGILTKNAPNTNNDTIWEKAARVGSLALLLSSIVSFLSILLLPYCTQSPYLGTKSTNDEIPPSEYSKPTKTFRLTMRQLWLLSHGVFALCTLSTLFVSSVAGSIVIFGLTGIAWAVTSWIPYTLLSIEISQRNQNEPDSARRLSWRDSGDIVPAGMVFGLHNIAICIPQIIISVASSILWKSDSSQSDPRSTGWVLRAGGVAAILALVLTTKIRDPRPEKRWLLLEAYQPDSACQIQ